MSTLSEIFRKDPLECTEADDDKIIARLKEFMADKKAFEKTLEGLARAQREGKIKAWVKEQNKEADELVVMRGNDD
jgi:hypothetical protein